MPSALEAKPVSTARRVCGCKCFSQPSRDVARKLARRHVASCRQMSVCQQPLASALWRCQVLGVEGAPAREATCEERECTNDCSYRGIWRNTTCECEPIYAGSDCRQAGPFNRTPGCCSNSNVSIRSRRARGAVIDTCGGHGVFLTLIGNMHAVDAFGSARLQCLISSTALGSTKARAIPALPVSRYLMSV